MNEGVWTTSGVSGGVRATPASVFQGRNATKPVGPARPIQDGWLSLTSTSGIEHRYMYKDMPHGWRPHNNYLSISTPTGRVNWPWRSIFVFETQANSPAFITRMREWTSSQELKAEEACEGADSEG